MEARARRRQQRRQARRRARRTDSITTVSILPRNGDGTLQSRMLYSFGGTAVGLIAGRISTATAFSTGSCRATAPRNGMCCTTTATARSRSVDTIPAPSNASCASLYDFDNDGTLDMALADEVSDEIVLRKNNGAGSVRAGRCRGYAIGRSAACTRRVRLL
jgi:hypothetical protein